MQTKLKVEFNSEVLYQDHRGCYWPVCEVGKGGIILNMRDFDVKAFQLFILEKRKMLEMCVHH